MPACQGRRGQRREIHVSPMSKTAAVNVGPGALSLAFAARGHQAH
jgi:fatty acid-binding protein DegV